MMFSFAGGAIKEKRPQRWMAVRPSVCLIF
jgi:hypothetical protein